MTAGAAGLGGAWKPPRRSLPPEGGRLLARRRPCVHLAWADRGVGGARVCGGARLRSVRTACSWPRSWGGGARLRSGRTACSWPRSWRPPPPRPGQSRCTLLPPLSLHRRAAHAQCAHVAHARASRARSRCLHGDDPAGGMAACWCALSRGVRGSGTPPVAGRPPGATPRGAAYPPATGLPPLGLQFREARVGGTACGRASLEAGAARRSCDSAARTAEPRWGGVPSWTRHGGDPCRSWGSKSQSTSCSN